MHELVSGQLGLKSFPPIASLTLTLTLTLVISSSLSLGNELTWTRCLPSHELMSGSSQGGLYGGIAVVCTLCSIAVDRAFINKLHMSVKQLKSSSCDVCEFLDILQPHLSVSGCKQLFSLYEQVFCRAGTTASTCGDCGSLLMAMHCTLTWLTWVQFVLIPWESLVQYERDHCRSSLVTL